MAAKFGLLIDYDYCTGCHSCEVSCKVEHDFGEGVWGIRVFDDGPWQKDFTDDQGKNFNYNKIAIPTDMCDGCADRLAKGREPVCAHHCLADVITFGTLEELAPKLAEKQRQVLWTVNVPEDCIIPAECFE